ncbi:hypothetical protein CEQ90_00525 [Lewinellaceae bacterium SD302]|nr:hypothetical protein CEQ90_00525 [Lewinellaceae bacterium SD302]
MPAQQEKPTTLLLETGLVGLFDDEVFGAFLHLEPRHNLSENTVIGLRLGITINTHSITNNDAFLYAIEEDGDNGVISFVPTFEYRWRNHHLLPHLGIGVGYYLLGDYVDVIRSGVFGNPERKYKIIIRDQPGFLIRAGLQPGKLRLGVEYNYVPKADLVVPDSQEEIGTLNRSYVGLSLGFVIGGGLTSK